MRPSKSRRTTQGHLVHVPNAILSGLSREKSVVDDGAGAEIVAKFCEVGASPPSFQSAGS